MAAGRILALLLALLTAAPAGAAEISTGHLRLNVALAAAGPLQCVLDALAARGYPVRFGRGYGRGTVRGSLHPAGMAVDVNQFSRNRTRPRMPRDEASMAAACGAVSGAAWLRNPDSGHFQVGGWSGERRSRARRRGRRHRHG